MNDLLTAALLLAGTFFLLVGSFGIVRMPDFYLRIHAQTKAGTLGLVGILLGAALSLGTIDVTVKALITILFQFLTAPVGAHMISRAAHHRKLPSWLNTQYDELK